MKNTEYYKSGRHLKNVTNARIQAFKQIELNKQNRINLYKLSPTICKNCNITLEYHSRKNKFCSKSCSASFNNIKRGVKSESTKLKISNSMKVQRLKSNGNIIPNRYSKIFLIECKICKKQRYVNYTKKHRQTCGSADCKTVASVGQRTYQNGSRKPVWFFNPYENKNVLLESSWEVEIANYLIQLGIEWNRPSFIKWVDSNNVTRRYFPDFYLPLYNMYLDPKNPYCIVRDKEKLEKVSQIIPLIYGSIEKIKTWIDNPT